MLKFVIKWIFNNNIEILYFSNIDINNIVLNIAFNTI